MVNPARDMHDGSKVQEECTQGQRPPDIRAAHGKSAVAVNLTVGSYTVDSKQVTAIGHAVYAHTRGKGTGRTEKVCSNNSKFFFFEEQPPHVKSSQHMCLTEATAACTHCYQRQGATRG